MGDARLLNIDISDLVEVAGEPEDNWNKDQEDKQALRESLRLERLADERSSVNWDISRSV